MTNRRSLFSYIAAAFSLPFAVKAVAKPIEQEPHFLTFADEQIDFPKTDNSQIINQKYKKALINLGQDNA
jgi:hypothetical protein